MILLHFKKFRVNPIITRRHIAKRRFSIWRQSAIWNLKNFGIIYLFIYLLHGLYRTLSHSQSEESQVRILLSSRTWNHNLHLRTKFH